MQETQSMEFVLSVIVQKFGIPMLTNGKLLISAYADLSNNKQDQRLIRYFVEAGGHTALLGAAKLSPAMQKTRFEQTVQKITSDTLINEEAVRKVCNAFWAAVYGTPMAHPASNQVTQTAPVQPARQSITQPPQYIPQSTMQTAADHYRESEAISKNKYYPYDKNAYYISTAEAQKGGDIPVYYKSDKLYITIPPNTKDKTPIRPVNLIRVIEPEKCTFKEKHRIIHDYSDELIRYGLDHETTKSLIIDLVQGTIVGGGFMYFLAFAILLTTAVLSWFLNALMPEVFGGGFDIDIFYFELAFDSVRNSIRSLIDIALRTWPLFIIIGSIVMRIRSFRQHRKRLQDELERRKSLPLRK